MFSVEAGSSIAVSTAPLRGLGVDLLIAPAFEGAPSGPLPELDAAAAREVSRARESLEFTGKPFELFTTPILDDGWSPRRLLLVGAGPLVAYGVEQARRVAAAGALAARQRRARSVAFWDGVGDEGSRAVDRVQAVAEGLTLGEFDSGQYKTRDLEPAGFDEATILATGTRSSIADLEAAVRRGRVLGECSNLARGLANEPGNALTPRILAERAMAIVREAGIEIEVLDEHRIEALGMGMLLGVARGSQEPPRLIVMRYEPAAAPSSPVLGLVGKGITFDSGGISIKPADGMERMKDDMAGGAAVICAMRAIGILGAPIRVVGIVPATENMPGGRAMKPGDVVRSAEGKTVEVVNTDAEGRLVLGDAMWQARQLGVTHLVDVATLTGACVVALGKSTSGLFGQPDAWIEHVRRVANRAGDRCWPMPTFDDYREQLRSEIADFMNTGGRPAGAITAAMFLKEFTGGLPWAHLDVAGTAWADEAKPYQPKGATGIGVRTLAGLAFTAGEWSR
jgi:leucyl aminopeptidase